MSLLTVITVIKDDVGGLSRTLDSIRHQQPAPVDLLVIDGSADRDEVPRLLSGYTLPQARYEWTPPAGIYPAMNFGLQNATGEYVYFLNAGDTLADDDVLARVCGQLISTAPPWAYGRVRFRQEDGSVLPEPDWDYQEEFDHWFARGRFPAHQGVVIATGVLREQGGLDTSYSVAADYASILKCARAARPLELGLTLAEFTVGGLSTVRWKQAQREFHRARRSILQPRGIAAVVETGYTWRSRMAATAYRGLWAPGRPAHGLVRRLRHDR